MSVDKIIDVINERVKEYAREIAAKASVAVIDISPTQPDTIPINRELWERVEALVRGMANWPVGSTPPFRWECEARAIVAMMPPAVDPDLLEARKIVAADMDDGAGAIACGYPQSCLDGDYDDKPIMAVALAAIRKGRELERGE